MNHQPQSLSPALRRASGQAKDHVGLEGSDWMLTALKASALAGAVAVIANLIVLFLGNVPQTVLTPLGRPIDALAVLLVSFFPVLFAGSVHYVLGEKLLTYRVLVVLLTLLSLILPLQLEAAPGTMQATLVAMHLVAGGAAGFLLPKIGETLAAED